MNEASATSATSAANVAGSKRTREICRARLAPSSAATRRTSIGTSVETTTPTAANTASPIVSPMAVIRTFHHGRASSMS